MIDLIALSRLRSDRGGLVMLLLVASAAATRPCLAVLPASSPSPLLFIDEALFAGRTRDVSLQVQPPTLEKSAVVVPTERWESWGIGGYSQVVQFGPGDYRLYYACVEYANTTVGSVKCPHGINGCIFQRLCLARSSDAVKWHKPSLGLYDFEGSTANNILLPCYAVSVFEDPNPLATAQERYKMFCAKEVYASPDGIQWLKLANGTAIHHTDDTNDVGWFDPKVGKYVIFVRRDLPILGRNCSGKYESKNTCRLIGRCETADVLDVSPLCRPVCSSRRMHSNTAA